MFENLEIREGDILFAGCRFPLKVDILNYRNRLIITLHSNIDTRQAIKWENAQVKRNIR